MPRWVLIDKSMGLNMPQPPETYHTSAALYSDLDIPTGISGTLPTAGRTRAGLSAEVEEDLGGPSRRRGGSRDSGGRDGGRDGGGRDGGRGGRGSSSRSRRGADEAPPAAGPSETRSGETSDRPRRQRRRREGGEDQALSGTGTAESPIDGTPAELGDTDEAARPVTRARSRRRVAPGTLFSDGTDQVAAAETDINTDPVDADGGAEPADGDDADRPRRRRRRGGRGSRGAGTAAELETSSDSAEMSGGSEAGVGTTADA
jgi:hypothetical protein